MEEEDLTESIESSLQGAVQDMEHLHLSYSNLEDDVAWHDGSATYRCSDTTAFNQLTSHIGE